MATSTLIDQRCIAVRAALADIRSLAATRPFDRKVLARMTRRLEQLASKRSLFPADDFPGPQAAPGAGGYRIYRLNEEDGDDGIALYLNAINPGEISLPHNHTTWATIVALEGEERNFIYRRLDDASDPTFARLEVVREITVKPGVSVGFMPEDLHSIQIDGTAPVLHFHLYGRPLDTLSERIGIHRDGAVVNYNAMLRAAAKAGQ